ncbi:hypothetical protein BZG35_10390 [Brevundimonas sp. LM2]|uniref:hypothetical protein n=1 Tax=Brevundimonas sp. LM2 TaxID=1938605 RepID=UPI000983924B|nr:hypothetical protein [Brevundimonas sp. LM2]AQR62008.1 hypothetical protein BZG35_10390 [Brevundimonas sp. LM2]
MLRRDLFALGTLAVAAVAAGDASASEEAPAGVAPLNIGGVAVPIIVGGRIRNYVFVTVQLTPGAGQTLETLRAKEPYYRDALVKAAHLTPFVLENDWTQVDSAAIGAMLVRAGNRISGPGAVAHAAVTLQTPRRRTGMRHG